jgi:hypothetical protein
MGAYRLPEIPPVHGASFPARLDSQDRRRRIKFRGVGSEPGYRRLGALVRKAGHERAQTVSYAPVPRQSGLPKTRSYRDGAVRVADRLTRATTGLAGIAEPSNYAAGREREARQDRTSLRQVVCR